MLWEGGLGLGLAAVLFAGSLARARSARAIVAIGATGAMLAAMTAVPLHLAVPMGDYGDYALQGQQHFAGYFDDGIRFQFHLGGALVQVLDAWFGKTESSPQAAFRALSRLAAVVICAGLVCLAWSSRWSAQSLRYLALVFAMPTTVLFFGYHEFGYLPMALDVVAIPLALVALQTHRPNALVLSGLLCGVGAALHGFGLVALAFVLVMAATYVAFEPEARLALGVSAPVAAGVAGVFGWLCWLPVYLIGFGLTVVPGHADESPVRPLLHAHYSAYYHRLDRPVLSLRVLGEIGLELALASATLFVVLARRRSPLLRAIAVGSLPALLFVIVYWPVQGLGNDTDLLGSVFPPAIAAAWLVAESRLGAAVGLLLLVPEQVAFRYVLTWPFVEGPTPPPS
jgi:hypothetical protein